MAGGRNLAAQLVKRALHHQLQLRKNTDPQSGLIQVNKTKQRQIIDDERLARSPD
jgi:hypothetical protein